MNKVLIRKSLIHLYTAIGFAVLSMIFYSPLLDGKKLYQSDINQYEAMSREIQENRENIPDEVYWIDNAFGGMPTFQLGAKFAYDILSPFHLLFRFIPRPAHTLFLYLLTMYILLMVLKIPWRIAILGSVAFAFSTYLLIILQVGHNTKALAIAYIPLVVAGLVLLRQNKLLPGFLVSLLGISLQIRANHYQMTYYMLILLGIYVIVYLIDSYRKQDLKEYLKYIGIFALAGILSLGLNAPNILSTYDYSKYSTRSQSELKLNPDGTEKELTIEEVRELPNKKNILPSKPCDTGPKECGPPLVRFFGGGGFGAAADAVVNEIGEVIGVNMSDIGMDYEEAPFVSIVDECDIGRGATAEAVVEDGHVVNIIVTNPGSNYLFPDQVADTEGVDVIGEVVGIKVLSTGANYEDGDMIVSDSGQTMTPVIENGRIVGASGKLDQGLSEIPALSMQTNTGVGAEILPITRFVKREVYTDPIVPQARIIHVISCPRFY